VIGEYARGQQARDASAQHRDPVKQDSGIARRLHRDDSVERGKR
jgi:uncharacterized MAPEG superfamily protein